MGKARTGNKNNRKTTRLNKTSASHSLRLEDLEQRLLLASDWQNPGNRFDVDDNVATQFEVSPIDANIIITELNNRSLSNAETGALPEIGPNDSLPENFIDVSGDGAVSPIDAIQVINQLNLNFSSGPTGSFVPTSQLGTTADGDDTMVSPTATDYANNPASDSNGGTTVVVWEQFNSTTNTWFIAGQRYNQAGEKVSTEFTISAVSEFSQRFPTVAVNEQGAFAVAWQSSMADGSWEIYARTYDNTGVETGDANVNSTTAGNQVNPAITFVDTDRVAIVWEGNGVGDHNGIHGREMLLNGTLSGNEFRVNQSTSGRQANPTIGATSNGTRVVAWEGRGVVDGQVSDGIFARVGNGDQIAFIGSNDVSHPEVSVANDNSWALAWLDGDRVSVQPIAADSNIVTGPELAMTFSGLEPLGATHNYEAWVIVNGTPVTAGVFDIDGSGNAINSDGSPATFVGSPSASAVVISIEPENDADPDPSATKVLGGTIDANGNFSLSIDHPAALNTDFSTAAGEFILATPTTSVTTDEFSGVWFIDTDDTPPTAGLDLPDLPSGWSYEGWVIIDGVPVSTGRFLDPAMADDFSGFSGSDANAPAFPGEDFVTNAPDGLTFPIDLRTNAAATPIVVSVEPSPDNSLSPFALKPLVGAVPSTATSGVNLPMTAGSVAVSGSGSFQSVDIAAGRITSNTGVRSGVALDHLPGGGFVMGWTGTTPGTSSDSISVLTQRFDAVGNAAGNVTVINNSSLIGFEAPSIAGGNGSYLTVWRGFGDDVTGIFGRLTSVPVSASLSLAAIADRTISEGTSERTETISATAVNATGTPTFSITTDWPDATINPTSGVISIPINEASGPNTGDITVSVSAGGESAQETFTFTVDEFNIAPNLGFIQSPSVNVGSPIVYGIPSAADVDLPDNTLTYVATQTGGEALPAWLSFDATELRFSGTPAATDSNVDITVTVTDSGGAQDTSMFTIIVVQDATNTAPSFSGVIVGNRSVAQGTALTPFTVSEATDSDLPAQTLTYSATQSDGSALPGWLNFNTATREFTGTPTSTDIGAVNVRVIATDPGGLTDDIEFTINVTGTNTSAPSFASASFADPFVVQNTTESFTVPAATDADVPAQALTYTATLTNGSALPSWLSFDAATRTFTAMPTNADLGDLTVVRVRATDPGGLSDDLEFRVRVRANSDPFFISPINNTIPTPTPGTFVLNLSIVDNDGVADSPTFALTSSDVVGAAVTPGSGQFTLPAGLADGTYNFTVSATENGFTDDEDFTIQVQV